MDRSWVSGERNPITRADAGKTLGDLNQAQRMGAQTAQLLETEFRPNLFLVFAIHQFPACERQLGWFLVLGYPVVQVQRGFVPMPFRADQDRPEETGHVGFVEFVEGRLRTADAKADHLIRSKSATLGCADSPQHSFIVQTES